MAEAAVHMPERLNFIDTAKAAGIVMVVLGHVADTPPAMVVLIYSLHMPLFFFVSGYLLAGGRLAEPFSGTVARGTRALLVPYVFFFALSLLYWLLTRNIGDRALKFAGLGVDDALWGLFTGRSVDLFVNPPLWFFPTLFVCTLLHASARRFLTAGPTCAVTLAIAIGVFSSFAPWDSNWPWGLDIAWMALVFYSAGHWLRRARPVQAAAGSVGPGEAAAMVALFALWVALALWQGRVDLAVGNFGPNPAVYVVTAMAGIGFVLLLARRIAPVAATRWLSDNALVIFPLHALTLNLGSGVVKLLSPGWSASGHGTAGAVAFATFAIVAVVPLAFLLTRYAPLVLGRRTAP